MDLGPVTADNVGGVLKVAAALTASGAILEKYAGVGEMLDSLLQEKNVTWLNLEFAKLGHLAFLEDF